MNKMKLKTLLITLSFSIAASGCTSESEQNTSKQESTTITSEESIGTIQDASEIEQLSDQELIEEIYQYLKYAKIPYPQEAYLLSDSQIKQLMEYAQSTTVCSWVNDFEYFDFNYIGLLETILKNSQTYVRTHPEYVSGNNILIDDVSLQEEAYQILSRILIDMKLDGSSNDIDEDICRLKDMKIVFAPTYLESEVVGDVVGEYVMNENVIIIYYQTLQKYRNENNKFKDLLRETLEHEINHVRQYACQDRLENGQLYSAIEYQEDCVCFLIESSAESELYAMNNDINIYNYGYFYDWDRIPNSQMDYSYSTERSHEGMLLMLNLFQPSKTIADYYEALYDSDYQKFFEFFDVENEEDAHELMDIIYNIDTLYDRTDFSKNYFGDYQPYLYEIRAAIGCNYTSRVFNKVLLSLMDYTLENEDFTLEENLIMFHIIKGIISSFAAYPELNGTYQYFEEEYQNHIDDLEFVNAYDSTLVQYINEAENKYVEFLQLHYGVTEEEIRKLENAEVASVINFIKYPKEYMESEKNKVISLADRFPLFTYVVFPNAYNIDYYDTFLEENGISYMKK